MPSRIEPVFSSSLLEKFHGYGNITGCISGGNNSRLHRLFYVSDGIQNCRLHLDHPLIGIPLTIPAEAFRARNASCCTWC